MPVSVVIRFSLKYTVFVWTPSRRAVCLTLRLHSAKARTVWDSREIDLAKGNHRPLGRGELQREPRFLQGCREVSDLEGITHFYDAVVARDLVKARSYLADNLVFAGVFETYRGPDEYLKSLSGLLSITVRLDVASLCGDVHGGGPGMMPRRTIVAISS